MRRARGSRRWTMQPGRRSFTLPITSAPQTRHHSTRPVGCSISSCICRPTTANSTISSPTATARSIRQATLPTKSSGWWAARGGWPWALGYRVLKLQDPAYAATLRDHFNLLRDVWTREVAATYGKFSPVHGFNVPGWLIGQGGDVTSIAVLGLLEYDQAMGGSDTATRDLLDKLCEALAAYQNGDDRNYPWGIHPDSAAAPLSWHAWGSTQTFALARAGKQLARPEWINSARREADTFYARLLAGEMVSEWGVLPLSYPQIAYGINSMTPGLAGAPSGDRG